MTRALALAVVLAACGREIHHTVDAPPVDTVVDVDAGDSGDPPADAVKLTIRRNNALVTGAKVVFQRTDSTLIEIGTTDINGRTWASMPDGGFVTAVDLIGPGLYELTTFATVVAGDNLVIDAAPVVTGRSGTLDVTVPVAGADDYVIQTSCGSGGADVAGTGTINLVDCPATIDIVVLPQLNSLSNGTALYLEAVPLPASGPLAINGTYASLATTMINYTNVPGEAAAVTAYQAISATGRAYQASASVAPTGGSAAINLDMPATTGTVLTVTTLYPTSGEIGQQLVYSWGVPEANKSINLASHLVPAYATAPAYDVGTHQVSWTERTGGTAPDAMRAKLQIYRDDIPAGTAWRWDVAGARAGASLTLPTLPQVNGFDFNPTATDTVAISELLAMRLPGGLAPWRPTIFEPFGHVVVGATGALTVQMLWVEQL